MARTEDKIVSVSRDPFGRFEVVKRYYGMGKCDWCGRKGKVWEYGQWPDGGRPSFARGKFCTKSCFEAYHG